ncbi:S-adenosyl-L-methionine-dependent methyltransferase [Ceratobasidium sp. AG-I]|nr:S-adenosyl-L-methionine-dependent methyltransferase [Ceratobasidium sp. AG-I]
MEYRDHATPAYQVTDQGNQHGNQNNTDHDSYLESDDDMFSETSSERTMSTLQSSQVTEYFRSIHGFTYLNNEDVPIMMPTDNLAERFDIVYHTIVRLAYGGTNVPTEIDELLQSGGVEGGTGGAGVLDMATNSGTWVQEMAAAYPTAKFVSVDVKPLTEFVPHPRIEFEVYNFCSGLVIPDASFDLVHARQCVALTRDFDFLLREMHRVLKPGGVLMLTEIPGQPYEVGDPSVPLHSSPRRAAGIAMFLESWASQGINIAPWDDMASRLHPSHPLWDNLLPTGALKPGERTSMSCGVNGFHSINEQIRLIPSGPWPADENQRIIGGLARLMFTQAWRALLPLLMMKGMDLAQAQSVVDGSLEEFMDDRYKSYMKCKIWTARRI